MPLSYCLPLILCFYHKIRNAYGGERGIHINNINN